MAGGACPGKGRGRAIHVFAAARNRNVDADLRRHDGMGIGSYQNVSTKSPPKVKELFVPFVLEGGLLLNGLLSV